ncbi:tripartite tricarboxylate transporter substrate binding protein [uncultured Paracoccus sp.]|uniref:Bug family tripartite tricarboxylate transporter substrate binding protein n=1 Tax=uncultured Paracoccus sp. TaxID=189685 RepID=UPI0025E1A6F5|nr:tripartite tricarboxylate transporter substrate binding protein [uncultured Paracoccus sp.]
MTMNALSRRRLVQLAATTAFAASFAMPGLAQDSALPSGPITIVVPFAAGGATDTVARLVAADLSKRLGNNVLVENVAGAGGTLGAARVSRAAPDGATLLMATVATHAIQPSIMANPPYDPKADFTAVSLLATVPNVLVVNNDFPAKTTAELVGMLKEKPDEYNYGSTGIGAPTHLSGELFKQMAGVSMENVPYTGGGPAQIDLIGGQIPILFDVLTGEAGAIRAGTVRALAVTTKERSPAFPDLPTVAESGVPGLETYETYTWNAIFGPAGLSPELVAELNKALVETVNDPNIHARLIELSASPTGSTPEELDALVDSELARWSEVIKTSGIELQ